MFRKIKENTRNMSLRRGMEYVLHYYWYHILGIMAVLGFFLFLIFHFAFPDKKPLFYCVFINQKIDVDRDEKVATDFANYSCISESEIILDSNYIISYPGNRLEIANESSIDKLFIKWSNSEIDAIVMTEDFVKYCIDVGGEFYSIDDFNIGNLVIRNVDGVSCIEIADTYLAQKLEGGESGNLLLLFPKEGIHQEVCQKFIDFIIYNSD